MTYFTSRPAAEQETIRAAYEFEREAMAADDIGAMSELNPYFVTIRGWPMGLTSSGASTRPLKWRRVGNLKNAGFENNPAFFAARLRLWRAEFAQNTRPGNFHEQKKS